MILHICEQRPHDIQKQLITCLFPQCFHIFSLGLFLILISVGWKWSNRPYRPRSQSRVPPEELSHDEGNENEDSKGAKDEDSE